MYREYAISEQLRSVARCTWQHTAPCAEVARVVPDACTDILWDGSVLRVAGPDTRPMPQPLAAGYAIVALRLAPGAGPHLFGASGTALRNARVELTELWGDRAARLAERLVCTRDAAEQRRLLSAAVSCELARAGEPDALVLESVQRLSCEELPSIAALAAQLGITERQLLRRSNVALGYGPKLLARILRFQRFLRALRAAPQTALAELAHRCGYADQAHLSHDTSELAGVTPGALQVELASDVRNRQDRPQPVVPSSRHANTPS